MQNGISPVKWDNANEGKEKLQKICIKMTHSQMVYLI